MSADIAAKNRPLPSAAVKICGLSRPEDVIAVNAVRADYAGFVFFEKSRRNISFAQAERLLERLDKRIHSVAVCVSPDEELIKNIIQLGFDIVQIHGTISEKSLELIPVPVWQAVNITDCIVQGQFLHLPQITGYVVDGAQYGRGRTFGWETNEDLSRSFWESVRTVADNRLFILAGGLNPENVRAGIQLLRPDVVDVSSGVEKNGFKDSDLMKQFVRKVRER